MTETRTQPESYAERVERERRTEAEKRAALGPLATEVARHIGGGWTVAEVTTDWPGATLQGPNGAGLYIRYQGYREWQRLEIASRYPDGAREAYRAQSFEITVSAEKSPAKIAGDITRRLLPGYLVELAAAREAIAEHRAAEARRRSAAAELATILNTEPWGDVVSLPARLSSGGRLTVNYSGDTVSVDLYSVPLDKARKIAAILGERPPLVTDHAAACPARVVVERHLPTDADCTCGRVGA